MKPTIYEFKLRGDERGALIAIEAQADIPFAIQRVYYIFATQPGVRRGLHAHRTLRQVLVCLNGSGSVLLDDGAEQVTVTMHKREQGILLEPMIWHEMFDFSPDCVLLVLASDRYDEGDYIRDYREFMQLAQTMGQR